MEQQVDNKAAENKPYNFLINSSNQANLTGTSNLSSEQINLIFLIIDPYYVEKFNMEGLDISISINEKGVAEINEQVFTPVQIKPGLSILGVLTK